MHELIKRKNKVKIEITCPVLEVPFSNNPQWIYEQNEFGEKDDKEDPSSSSFIQRDSGH